MDFDKAFQLLMGDEGAYVDSPDDPGGASCWSTSDGPSKFLSALRRGESNP